MNQSIAEAAIVQMVRAINIWLQAAGHPTRVLPRDIEVLHVERDGHAVFILAFREETPAPDVAVGKPYSTMTMRNHP